MASNAHPIAVDSERARARSEHEPTVAAARHLAVRCTSHLGPAVRGTLMVLGRAMGEAAAMSLVAPLPPDEERR